MTPTHRLRGKSLHLDLPPNVGDPANDRPSLAALFLIKFDVKAGYTIAWKRSTPGVELTDSVEFKSLPSGLHNVAEDLVYFMHGDAYAGISAFVNTGGEQWERNALMIAVGALVPLEYGRLGRSWRHAQKLKDIAKGLAADINKTDSLEQYWDSCQASEEPQEPEVETAVQEDGAGRRKSQDLDQRSRRRARVKSMSSAFGVTGAFLAPMHPALALPKLIHAFGPLLFPLYKAALLRKRILLVNEAPVELACNFVYNISIISNIPPSIAESIPLEPLPHRLQPLFSIGVHDIDEIMARNGQETTEDGQQFVDEGYGWVACTTDHVLGTKKDFYDVLVNIPYGAVHAVPKRSWPSLITSANAELRASQRDLRRYRALRQSQKRSSGHINTISPFAPQSAGGEAEETPAPTSDEDETSRLIPPNTHETFDDASSTMDEKLIEPMSWSALAYSSFMWWASAGEKRADLEDEAERDASLFRDYNSYADTPGSSRSRSRLSSSSPGASAGMSMLDGSAVPEMAIIGYFHRMTSMILGTLAAIVDSQDPPAENSSGADEPDADAAGESAKDKDAIYVTSEDMARMGLDVWSDADRQFVEELIELYWGRAAEVQGGRIECCGVRVL